MERPFHLLQQFRDVVETQARPNFPQVPCSDLEWHSSTRPCPVGYAKAQRFVDDVSQRAAGTARFVLYPGRDIVIERKRCLHAVMLCIGHDDVKM